MKRAFVEYIWLDGAEPTQALRSKSRLVTFESEPAVSDLPDWGFDGSSTNQADGNDSDCELKPVRVAKDPLRGEGYYLALCEVYNADGSVHATNKRASLVEVMEKGGNEQDAYVGFEQEYTLFNKSGRPLGWPEGGYPAPQGPFYCGVGASNIFGREICDEHAKACEEAGLNIYGTNAEVMPGQWEFQIGYRAFDGEAADPLTMSDHVWLARFLLQRISEKYDVTVSFENKPIKGDWNGAGMHTNFSTRDMRDKSKGMGAIESAVNNLAEKHQLHIENYGSGLADRLTGLHETCSINEFRSGNSDRGASIRIPMATTRKGYGYIEDRRPGANSDPYIVSELLMKTICNL
tara:strand:+ start:500 stop:1546 length:1047 start_codon:yes stop_codon:yes gene_type:complete